MGLEDRIQGTVVGGVQLKDNSVFSKLEDTGF